MQMIKHRGEEEKEQMEVWEKREEEEENGKEAVSCSCWGKMEEKPYLAAVGGLFHICPEDGEQRSSRMLADLRQRS